MAGKVLLKDSKDRLVPYQMTIEGQELVMSSNDKRNHVVK